MSKKQDAGTTLTQLQIEHAATAEATQIIAAIYAPRTTRTAVVAPPGPSEPTAPVKPPTR